MVIFIPVRVSASNKFGVITEANGNNFDFINSIALFEISISPEVATITGSTTKIKFLIFSNSLDTVLTEFSSGNIPVLTALKFISFFIAIICFFIIFLGII